MIAASLPPVNDPGTLAAALLAAFVVFTAAAIATMFATDHDCQ